MCVFPDKPSVCYSEPALNPGLWDAHLTRSCSRLGTGPTMSWQRYWTTRGLHPPILGPLPVPGPLPPLLCLLSRDACLALLPRLQQRLGLRPTARQGYNGEGLLWAEGASLQRSLTLALLFLTEGAQCGKTTPAKAGARVRRHWAGGAHRAHQGRAGRGCWLHPFLLGTKWA